MGDDTVLNRTLFGFFAVVGMAALQSVTAYAHCDGLDGPVVKAAQEALGKRHRDEGHEYVEA
jgi:hypothetical protein